MLTARGDEIDEVVALEVGADDYMSKPVRPRALLARLRVHLRRNESQPSSTEDVPTRLNVDSLTIDSSSRAVQIEGNAIELTTAEFDLLWMLAINAGSVVSRISRSPAARAWTCRQGFSRAVASGSTEHQPL